jgi:hypothetical protein
VKIKNYFKEKGTIPLTEEEFRYVLTHFDGAKFVLELSISQVSHLLINCVFYVYILLEKIYFK